MEVSSLNTLSGASQFTLSGWFNKADTGHRIGISYDNSGSNRTSIFYNTDSNVYLSVAAGSANYGAFSLASTDWVHIVMVFDGTASGNTNRLKGYVDGVEQTLTYNSTIPAAAHSQSAVFRIGKDQGHGLFSQGGIDDVAVWDTALDGDAIRALYNAGLPTPVPTKTGADDIYRDNLKAYYKMGDASDPAADGTSNLLFDQPNPGLGTEKVTNGAFDGIADGTDPVGNISGWAAYNSVTTREISGEKLKLVTTSSASGALLEISGLTTGKTYKFSCDFVDVNGVNIASNSGTLWSVFTSNSPAASDGKITMFATISSGTSIGIYFRCNGAVGTGGTAYFDNISFKEVNGNTGTISGATIQTEAPKAIMALPPVANTKSITFDGTNDHLVTQVDSAAQPNNESRYYSFWAKSSNTSTQAVFSHGGQHIGGFLLNSGGKPLLYMASTVYQYWVDTTSQDDNAWHHWVVKIKYNDLTGCELWCDGVKQTKSNNDNNGSMNAYSTGIQIGAASQQGSYFNGSIDEFSIHEDLDEEAIRALFNRGRPIDVSSGHGAYDLSDKALHWWRMGDATSPAADGTNDIIYQGF